MSNPTEANDTPVFGVILLILIFGFTVFMTTFNYQESKYEKLLSQCEEQAK